jgi:hypothetical protein
MKERVIRIRMSEELYQKFKIMCAQLDLSIPKQNEALIRNFVEIQEENIRNINEAKQRNENGLV